MLRFLIPLATAGLAACAADTPTTESTSPVALYDADETRRDLDELIYLGGLEYEHPDPRFGGWSALELSADQSQLLAVSDSAYWMTAEVSWNDQGGIEDVHSGRIEPILSRAGETLDGEAADSETIANLGDGRIAVSFERQHRINVYPLGADWSGIADTTGEAHSIPPGSDSWPNNGGLEGLTPLSDGGLLAVVEYPPEGESAYLLWHHQNNTWSDVRVAAEPDFGMTALTVHEGWVYALERFWRRGEGNRIRIIRFSETSIRAEGVIQPELLGRVEGEHAEDNFEGIAVFARNDQTVLVIMSDDNYSDSQRTLLLSFALTGAN